MKSIYKKIVLSVIGMLAVTGCQDDFLDRPSQSQIDAEHYYQTKDEIRLATAALYGGEVWAQWNNNPYLMLGDIMSGNLLAQWYNDAVQLNTFTLSGANQILVSGWTGSYIIVAHANATINGIQKNTPATVAEADKNAGIAEAKFIRAMAYYHLTMLWGEVPIIEDNTLLIKKPLINKHKQKDVFQFIVNDLTFAAANLPPTDAKGRVTKWSAKGMLSKVYLIMAGFEQSGGTRDQNYLDLAKTNALDVIQNSGLELLPDYANLFKTQFNDNSESLFALQWSATTGYMKGSHLLTHSPSAEINPGKDGAWTPLGVTYDLYKLYSSTDLRRKPTFMLPGDHYPELNAAGGGYTATGAVMKKHIIGNGADNNTPAMSFWGSTEHNALLRLADVYLIYAEAVLGNNASTSDATALLYFNKVRTRAEVNNPATVLNGDVIFNERRKEFACEGQLWFDLVRLSYYYPEKAINFLNEQQRVLFEYNQTTGEVTVNDPVGAISPASISTFKIQLPASEITANPKLAEPAVPYFK